MKKYKFLRCAFQQISVFLIFIFAFTAMSCATLQKDIYTSSEENAYIYSSIEIYEYQFINIDSEYFSESKPQIEAINRLVSEIHTYKTSRNVTEPFLIARLSAFEGLLYKMTGKNGEAQASYQEARNLQKGDRYVQLLGTRLEKSIEKSLSVIEDILLIDEKNAVILLEKGKILYRLNRYNEAVAVMDNAFMLFDSEGYKEYRQVYARLRNNAWELNKISDGKTDVNISKIDLQGKLTLTNMVELALYNTTILDSFKPSGKQNVKTDKVIDSLNKSRYFCAPLDQKNENDSASEILQSGQINRKLCARFIWNAYVRNYGNLSMLSRYSEKYKKSNRTKSPIADVSVDDKDFDAVLGVIENEFMDLPDGRNFNPDDLVTNLQFITWIKKAEK